MSGGNVQSPESLVLKVPPCHARLWVGESNRQSQRLHRGQVDTVVGVFTVLQERALAFLTFRENIGMFVVVTRSDRGCVVVQFKTEERLG